ncbi:hypothetical protein AQUCO_00500282v1 [Aquilegia coerulea]|uniref:Uncharacterized protein n=2 Tax=Aquilegia coerulea TaxID=218851 RepID=A0A2G5ER60_AQUCA|nr:hypothetical protein AQUCO_00500282v1 [Aquilegia coerulea]
MLQGDEEQKFSILIHSRPGFIFNKGTTRSAYFYDRQISDSIQVDWGEATMILAERILLKNALKDSDNQRFAFVLDSCIPLYNFSYTYDYIMSTPNSFVDSFADTKEGRYNPKMDPIVPVHNWRKGSQIVFSLDICGVKNIVGIPFGYRGFFDKSLSEIPLSWQVARNINLVGGSLVGVSPDYAYRNGVSCPEN